MNCLKFHEISWFYQRDHAFSSTYAKSSEKVKFLTNCYVHVREHIRGVRNVTVLENFTYIRNNPREDLYKSCYELLQDDPVK